MQVIAYTNAGDSFLVTSNYVTPARSTIQGSYLDLPLMTNAAKFELLLTGNGSTYGYVGLSEVEIYAGGENMYDRYVFMGLDATKPVFRVSNKARLKPVSSATESN